jgi:hypothetical protein
MTRSCDNKIEKLLDERDAHIRDQVRRAIALISVGHSVEFIAKKVRLDVPVVRRKVSRKSQYYMRCDATHHEPSNAKPAPGVDAEPTAAKVSSLIPVSSRPWWNPSRSPRSYPGIAAGPRRSSSWPTSGIAEGDLVVQDRPKACAYADWDPVEKMWKTVPGSRYAAHDELQAAVGKADQ